MPRKATLAALCPALWLLVALQQLGGAAAGIGDGAYIYGVRRNPSTRFIMEINPELQVSTAVYDTGLDSSTNGVAYDRSRKQVLFVSQGNNVATEAGLWAYDIPHAVLHQLTTNWTVLVPAEVDRPPQDAVWYHNAYWCALGLTFGGLGRAVCACGLAVPPPHALFMPVHTPTFIDNRRYIPDATAALWKASLNYDAQNIPTSLATVVQYPFSTSTVRPDMFFGDIVIDVS